MCNKSDIPLLVAIVLISSAARGEDGEITICGPQVMHGYWQRPEENQAVFREVDGRRFFLTGDVGHFDEQGYLVCGWLSSAA